LIRTVDLVIDGGGSASHAAARDALKSGRCVLVVLRSDDGRVARRFRRCVCKAANVDVTQMTVMTNAEVVCVDGVDGVEAVVVRYTRTGRLCAVNTTAFLSCDVRRKRRRHP